MRRVSDVLAQGNKQIGQIMAIRSRWSEIAGEVLRAHTEPVQIKNRVLVVLCDSPAWAQQVGMLAKVLEKQIRAVAGISVRGVEGKFGHVSRPPARKRPLREVKRPDIDPDDVARLKDKGLASVIRELMAPEEGGNG